MAKAQPATRRAAPGRKRRVAVTRKSTGSAAELIGDISTATVPASAAAKSEGKARPVMAKKSRNKKDDQKKAKPEAKVKPERKAKPEAKVKAETKIKSAQKVKSERVVRDSFTMPLVDYDRIGALKKRCLGMGIAVKKTELLRAGLAALMGLADDHLKVLVGDLARVRTGRPPSDKKKRKKQPKGKKP